MPRKKYSGNTASSSVDEARLFFEGDPFFHSLIVLIAKCAQRWCCSGENSGRVFVSRNLPSLMVLIFIEEY